MQLAKVFTNDDEMIELYGVSFTADQKWIFKEPNPKYIDAEIEWYESKSRNVNDLADIYGQRVKIWDDVADADGYVNSNYGWCIYSAENDFQYDNCIKQLRKSKDTRRAVMVYTRPSIQYEYKAGGMNDFICTNVVHYSICGQNLYITVQMRSNDAVFGYNNDLAWQKHVGWKIIKEMNEDPEMDLQRMFITWQVANFHVYPRHRQYV